MQYDIKTEERIDNYLLGRMSDNEKAAFERELEENPELKEEFECQKAVAHAARRVAMRELLKQHAAQRKDKKNLVIKFDMPFRTSSERIKKFFGKGHRGVWTFATVAAMFVCIIGGLDYQYAQRSFQESGMMAYNELELAIAKDGNELDSVIEEAYNHIGNKEYDQALESINSGRAIILESPHVYGITQEAEGEYGHTVLMLKGYELDWYEAIVLMREGKVIKARRALKKIASSGSPYAETAREYLNNRH